VIRYSLYLSYFVSFFFITSCKRDAKILHSYYYWRSVYKTEKSINEKLGKIKDLYVKFFDVVWKDQLPQPISIIKWADEPINMVIPVVYITNEVMQNIKSDAIDSLALKIVTTVNGIHIIKDELQIDCDWSETSRKKYFQLLRSIKNNMPKSCKLTCTIRLHQLKFASRTGIPPVDRGMLMLYNMASLGDYETVNSIFDPKLVDIYLNDVNTYALQLDLALPTYQQCVLFRNNQFVSTLRHENFFDPSQDKVHFEHYRAWYYRCINDTTIQNIHIAKGDHVRFEKIDVKECERYIAKIATINNIDSIKVVYFDIHS
jgi:hypothetical protein